MKIIFYNLWNYERICYYLIYERKKKLLQIVLYTLYECSKEKMTQNDF